MINYSATDDLRMTVIHRGERYADIPVNSKGEPLKIGQFYGENVFNIHLSKEIPNHTKVELEEIVNQNKPLTKELAQVVAKAVTKWAVSKGVTHFCHWFHPLTGATAEKHDAMLDFDDETPIEKLSASQLMQGEPDASSFPHGGSRSTFEARGYTSWDFKSPIFIMEGPNGKTLCIPTAFVSYHGDALDIKTPLLRSSTTLDKEGVRFLHLTGRTEARKVVVTCGAEQEYFLVDRSFYYARPDLVMTGRTLCGSLTSRNQQLEDHYFGEIQDRVLGFMQEVEIELYRLGIPAKTRHNEVAPGQFELAPVFKDANIAADQNQLVMAILRKVALKHDFVVLLHEKPFAGINGSGKHLNWSMSDDLGNNFLEPGKNPHENYRFLAMVSICIEAVRRHAKVIRMAIAGHGNDHRLGANEAPPSIISAYLGDTLSQVLDAVATGKQYVPNQQTMLDLGAGQLTKLLKDNTDRNRTSPFAFTGNKFEFRAVGSSAAIGFPLSVLNAAIADVLMDSNDLIEADIKAGKSIEDALISLIKKWYSQASHVVFNGDGYSKEWVEEAERRGLPNFRTTPDVLAVMKDESVTAFLSKTNVFRPSEVKTRYNVLLERYIKHREIEFSTLEKMVSHYILPSGIAYKSELANLVKTQKDIGVQSGTESKLLTKVTTAIDSLYAELEKMQSALHAAESLSEEDKSFRIAKEIMPQFEKLSKACNALEDVVPSAMWALPTYYDMLFLR